MGNQRLSHPEQNPLLPTAVTPKVLGSGNYWRNMKRADETETLPLQMQGRGEIYN